MIVSITYESWWLTVGGYEPKPPLYEANRLCHGLFRATYTLGLRSYIYKSYVCDDPTARADNDALYLMWFHCCCQPSSCQCSWNPSNTLVNETIASGP